MAKIIGNTTATTVPQSDWNQTDETKADYIKNKPDLGKKVDKEDGKGLSTNDYTNDDKEKLAGLENYDDTELKTSIIKKIEVLEQYGSTDVYTFVEKDGDTIRGDEWRGMYPVTIVGCSQLKGAGGFYVLAIPEYIDPDNHDVFVDSIGENAFRDCIYIYKVKLPQLSSRGSIGKSAFQGSTLEEINIPAGLDRIEDCTFKDCTDLVKVVFGQEAALNPKVGLEYIGEEAFANTKLNANPLILPDSVTEIGTGAFKDSGIKSIVLPSALTSIPENCFYNCEHLEKVIIPSGVTRIEDWAFARCTNLASIEIPVSVTFISQIAFSASGVKTIYGYKGSYVEEFLKTYEVYSDVEFVDITGLGTYDIRNCFNDITELKDNLGEIETALDSIITIQNELIGGESI